MSMPSVEERVRSPNYDGMVAVQKGGSNGGWAMSPDQECSYGSWCPYACKPGQLMGQWDPSATTYSYPKCQNGGLYCDSNGNLQKPNSDKDYCYDGKGTVIAKNNANSGDVAFCQTVLPGNEAMLIPTLVGSGSKQTLAVPGTDYWASTASHYYVNAPGVSVEDACQWGSSANPQGNWAPFVAGSNMDDNQNTFVKIDGTPSTWNRHVRSRTLSLHSVLELLVMTNHNVKAYHAPLTQVLMESTK